MLRITPIENASQAETYYSKSDGGYYHKPDDLRTAWMGRGAELLGLSGPPDYEEFKRLIHGCDPRTGEQLTAKILENRIPGWDVNVHCPKGVTTILESGDSRIQDALWEATQEAIADLERFATTRVRKDGRQEDRVTGNVVAYAVEHAETRPAKEDKMPDPHRHIHVVIFNLTFDRDEGEWKAVKMRPVMDLRKYFDRRFNQRFASKVADLGYEIETKWDRNAKGHRKYMGWDVKGVPESVVKKFSRRSGEIEKLAEELGVTGAVAKDKLGATSRQSKRKDLTLNDCRKYWQSRITPAEAQQISGAIERAKLGLNTKPEPQAAKAMEFAISHHFERQAVVPEKSLEITAMERSMGAALPEEIEEQTKRHGLLVRDGEATTKQVLAEENRLVAYARNGRGTVRPLADRMASDVPGLGKLSAEQQAVCRHIWKSSDRVMLVRGGAGTGKTTAMRTAADGIEAAGKQVFAFALSSDASRGVLRREGFPEAETIKKLLDDKNLQEEIRGQVVFLDEGSLIGNEMLRQVFDLVDELGARCVIFGDKRQHGSIERGATMEVLERYAGLPVVELSEIRRQTHKEYKQAVAAIMKGEIAAGHDVLDKLGWVKQTPVFNHNAPLIDDYLETVRTRKPNGENMSALIVAPTHKESDEITTELRDRLKEEKLIGDDQRMFPMLKPLDWTEAERSDPKQYDGTEIVQFHRNSGPFKAGQRVAAPELLKAEGYTLRGAHFSVYRPGEIELAEGDTIRMTATSWTKERKHRAENGSIYQIDGFTAAGDIQLDNGWVLAKSVGQIKHGYVSTSFAAQGKTSDHVLIALGRESEPAMSTAQYYVSVSRGRSKATIYSNMSASTLREAILRPEPQKSAIELMSHSGTRLRDKAWAFAHQVRSRYRQWRDKAERIMERMIELRGPEYVR